MKSSSQSTSVKQYISELPEPRRNQISELHDFITKTLPDFPVYMQSGMIAYGTYHYKYDSGREGDWPIVLLASRKNYISVYVSCTENGRYLTEKYTDKLNADIGKSCIRFKKFEDIDFQVLKELLHEAGEWKFGD